MRLRLVPQDTKFDFFNFQKLTFGLSAAAMVLSIILFFVIGLNYGIDFRGGSMIMAETPGPVEVATYRDILGTLDLGDVTVTEISDPAAVDGITYLATESVGAKVSGELVQAGIIAVCLAVTAVLFYIWLRFEWQFSVGAVAALIHDVILTIGIFALFSVEFNLSIIAALLTIVGYSLNDTVVVFDRVREKKFKKTELVEVLNLSINQTLGRTIMTSGTTLLALIALYVLGGEVIRGFTFAMIWGVIVGTYSSIFVASAVLLRLGVTRDWDKSDKGAGTQFGNVD